MHAAPLALGIDLGGTKIHAALLADDGRIGWQRRCATPAGDYAGTLRALAALIEGAAAQAGARGITVGIGGPGSLTAGGCIKNSNSTCLNGQPLPRDLAALIGRPVRYANDANCLALSEATDGAAAGCNCVFAAILGTGTGAGIVVGGRVLQGPHGMAGEWGHNPLPWRDAAADPVFGCYCGQQGCNETLLSGPGIARDHALRHGGALPAAAIAQGAEDGDAGCRATLDRHAARLARALAAVINLLDPDVIVLGGGLSLMPHLYGDVPAQWQRWLFAGGERITTPLKPSLHGDASGVRGAAWLGRDGTLRSAATSA